MNAVAEQHDATILGESVTRCAVDFPEHPEI
ncbi:hypothetical protein SAMN05421507_103126 [Lentzea jiangxiensis]|uniref:Uncharacterized protein n=1 Tax=Lentzea jiangxiensis TaxID=641025 RepID=A0A1H0KZ75_9PSEU|nr:hypothetical protein SAMN05421507_103126 [Lentzea jiangxiensis]